MHILHSENLYGRLEWMIQKTVDALKLFPGVEEIMVGNERTYHALYSYLPYNPIPIRLADRKTPGGEHVIAGINRLRLNLERPSEIRWHFKPSKPG